MCTSARHTHTHTYVFTFVFTVVYVFTNVYPTTCERLARENTVQTRTRHPRTYARVTRFSVCDTCAPAHVWARVIEEAIRTAARVGSSQFSINTSEFPTKRGAEFLRIGDPILRGCESVREREREERTCLGRDKFARFDLN